MLHSWTKRQIVYELETGRLINSIAYIKGASSFLSMGEAHHPALKGDHDHMLTDSF